MVSHHEGIVVDPEEGVAIEAVGTTLEVEMTGVTMTIIVMGAISQEDEIIVVVVVVTIVVDLVTMVADLIKDVEVGIKIGELIREINNNNLITSLNL